jgi:multiple sugar transport system permease protein
VKIEDETKIALLLILPSLVGVAIFYYYPVAQTVIFSLYKLNHTQDWITAPFVGLGNYAAVLSSPQFWDAVVFTLYFMGVSITLEFWIGLGMALATFWVPSKMRGIVLVFIVLPWAIPPIMEGLIWKLLLNYNVGLISQGLVTLGLVKSPPLFLEVPAFAQLTVMVADAWKMSSIMAILLLAGLATIEKDVLDAAKVDGARAWYRFWKITLPMISPMIMVALLFRMMDAIRLFDLIFAMTGGGPGTVTTTLSLLSYTYYFTYVDFGLGSAYAIVVFLAVFVISLLYVTRLSKHLRFKGEIK